MASSIPSDGKSHTMWSTVLSYLISPVSAGAAIVLPYYGLVAKTALQLSKPIPKMSVAQALWGGAKAAPTVGAIVGTQMVTQALVEKYLFKRREGEVQGFEVMLASSILVGAASVHPLAAFNGLTMNRSLMESVKGVTKMQAGAIVSREICFLFSMRASEPISKKMQALFGTNNYVEGFSAFVTGAVGSYAGHMPDTWLTLLQKEIKVLGVRHLLQGAHVKAASMGVFTTIYVFTKNYFQSLA